MVSANSSAYGLRRLLERKKDLLDRSAFTVDGLLASLSRLAAAVWRPHDQPPVSLDEEDLERVLSLGQKLEAFLNGGGSYIVASDNLTSHGHVTIGESVVDYTGPAVPSSIFNGCCPWIVPAAPSDPLERTPS